MSHVQRWPIVKLTFFAGRQNMNSLSCIPDEFPIKTSRALRGALAMREFGLEERFMEQLFRAYWEANDASIQDFPTLTKLAESLGVSGRELVTLPNPIGSSANSLSVPQGGLEAGVFGAPTMVIDKEIYWGKDRFDFIRGSFAAPNVLGVHPFRHSSISGAHSPYACKRASSIPLAAMPSSVMIPVTR